MKIHSYLQIYLVKSSSLQYLTKSTKCESQLLGLKKQNISSGRIGLLNILSIPILKGLFINYVIRYEVGGGLLDILQYCIHIFDYLAKLKKEKKS